MTVIVVEKEPAKRMAAWARFCATSPLALPAGLLVIGMVLGMRAGSGPVWLAIAAAAWLGWLVAECAGMRRMATAAILCAIAACGGLLWQTNQQHVAANHLVRFLAEDETLPIAARVHVLSVDNPSGVLAPSRHEGVRATVEMREAFFDDGWRHTTGTATLRIAQPRELQRGDAVEIYGWVRRPSAPQNPGEFDFRQYLARSRIFCTIDVQRASQVISLAHQDEVSVTTILTAFRTFLRGKLLEHTADMDAESGNTLVALLLGYRDPSIQPIARDFTKAGVAHLLAISGSHIVFFAALAWWALKFVVRRPRHRAIVTMLVVVLYVLATPCGPPVIRAGIATVMVLLTMLAGRGRSTVNMLAAALIAVLIFRPADLLDPGLQLSFVSTAGLVLLAARIHRGLLVGPIGRQEEIWRIIDTPVSRIKAWLLRTLLLAFTANLVGALTAAPLVLYHFNQFNTWSIFTGLLALPVVTVNMVAALVQLLLEITAPALAAWTATITVWLAWVMNMLIGKLAAMPAAAIAVRTPPAWIVLLAYIVLIVWILRKFLQLPRAQVSVLGAASLAMIIAAVVPWPPRQMEVCVLAVGRGNAMIVQTPQGRSFLINAGAQMSRNTATRIVDPALRHLGINQLDGLIVTSGDRHHASDADDMLALLPTQRIIASDVAYVQRDWQLSATQLFDTAVARDVKVTTLSIGDILPMDAQTQLRVLWPPQAEKIDSVAPWRSNMIFVIEAGDARLLVMHPKQDVIVWQLLQHDAALQVDAVLFTDAPDKSPLTPMMLQRLHAKQVVWSDARQSRRLDKPMLPTGHFITGEQGATRIRLPLHYHQ